MSAFSLVKRDLAEFTSTMHEDSTKMAANVKEKLTVSFSEMMPQMAATTIKAALIVVIASSFTGPACFISIQKFVTSTFQICFWNIGTLSMLTSLQLPLFTEYRKILLCKSSILSFQANVFEGLCFDFWMLSLKSTSTSQPSSRLLAILELKSSISYMSAPFVWLSANYNCTVVELSTITQLQNLLIRRLSFYWRWAARECNGRHTKGQAGCQLTARWHNPSTRRWAGRRLPAGAHRRRRGCRLWPR